MLRRGALVLTFLFDIVTTHSQAVTIGVRSLNREFWTLRYSTVRPCFFIPTSRRSAASHDPFEEAIRVAKQLSFHEQIRF